MGCVLWKRWSRTEPGWSLPGKLPRWRGWRLLVILALVPLFSLATSASAQGNDSVDSERLLRVTPRNDREVDVLERDHQVVRLLTDDAGLLQVILASDQDSYERLLEGGWLVAVIDEAPAAVDFEPTPFPLNQRTMSDFSCYRTVEETYTDLAALASANPMIAQWSDFGDSWEKVDNPSEGEDLKVLILGNVAVSGKVPLVLSSAMHARELTTAELLARFAERLISDYDSSADVRWILDTVEIHIIAQMNPDGRKKVEVALPSGADIWWRKNTNTTTCGSPGSVGTDLNRNSSFEWGDASAGGCTETYRGLSAGSEPETMAIEAYLRSVFADQRGELLDDAAPLDSEGAFVSVHSFGEIIFLPWEWNEFIPAPNRTQLDTLGRKLGHYTGYQVCADCDGEVSGTNVDFAYGELGVAAYTYELGTSFHQDCSYFESSIVESAISSLVYLAKATRRPYQWPSGPEALEAELDQAIVTTGDSLLLSASVDDTRYNSGGNGIEPTHNIAAAYYTVDAYPWTTAGIPMSATDGVFNSKVESVQAVIDTTGLGFGAHTLYITAEDTTGAVGVPTAINFVLSPLFADDFESGGTGGWSP